MAKLKSSFPLAGAFDNFTAYRLPGVEGIVVRRKGGVPGHVIRTAPKYENTRRNASEFGGRSRASGWIMRMMHPVNGLADHSIGGPLNALLKPVQELDTENELGKRSVMITRNKFILQGFSLNENYPINHVIRTAPFCSISRSGLSATIQLPDLIPQINFFPSPLASFYSIVAVLGVVPDLLHSSNGYEPSHDGYVKLAPVMVTTSWHPTTVLSAAPALSLHLPSSPPDENFSLFLSVGVRYGLPGPGDTVIQKAKSGCGAIMALA